MHLVGDEIGLHAIEVVAARLAGDQPADQRLQGGLLHRPAGIVIHAGAVAVEPTAGHKQGGIDDDFLADLWPGPLGNRLQTSGMNLVDQASQVRKAGRVCAPVASPDLPAVVDEDGAEG